MTLSPFDCTVELAKAGCRKLSAGQRAAFLTQSDAREAALTDTGALRAADRAAELCAAGCPGAPADPVGERIYRDLTALELELLAAWTERALADEAGDRDPELPVADPLAVASYEITARWGELDLHDIHPDTRATTLRLLRNADVDDLHAFDRQLDKALRVFIEVTVGHLATASGLTAPAAQVVGALAASWQLTWDDLLAAAPLVAAPWGDSPPGIVTQRR